MGSSLRIAIVDAPKFKGWYTWNLSNSLSRLLSEVNGALLLYLPKKFKSLSIDENSNLIVKFVWSPFLYPFQIPLQARKDNVQLIHIQFEFFTFGPLLLSLLIIPLLVILKLLKIKRVVTIHGPLFPKNEVSYQVIDVLKPRGISLPAFIVRSCIITFYRIINSLADCLIVHANIFRRWLKEWGIKNCCVIHHGVRGVINQPLENEKGETSVILYFGVISPRKGLEYLIRSFAAVRQKLQHVKLIIAGKYLEYYTGYKEVLIKLVRELQLENSVIFTGYVDDNELHKLLIESDILVLPYLYSVSASGPLELAIMYGKPLIVTSTEYFSEILRKDVDAIFVPPKSVYSLENAILTLLQNRVLREMLAKNIKEKSIQYSWDKVAEKTVQVYSNILHNLRDK